MSINGRLKIPTDLIVGFRNRKDTYTGKLSYITYYKEDKKNNKVIAKETSWIRWRDSNIEPLEIENVPTEGFVLNKHVGGCKSGWNFRQSYCRIYDPRDFEFEITMDNLLYILDYCDCIKGKGLIGKFIYAWDGSNLVLLPVSTPEYQESLELKKNIEKGKPTNKTIKVGSLYKDKKEMHNLNIFMSRLLFCYFAEDTNLFPEQNLFTNAIIQFTAEDGHDLAEFIDRAFLAMSTNDPAVRGTLPKQYSMFPYVNGALFEKRVPVPVLSRRARVLMIKCGDFQWKDINPDIFGSMIQAVVTPEMRAGLGMHYTSVPNIMKLIRPLFIDGLYEEFNVARDTSDIKRLRRLLARLGNIKFFDPACGSGNFLIVSYKCVHELEIHIWEELRRLNALEIPFSNISLQQFYGIEIDDFACDTATLSLWLAEHQMNNKFQSVLDVHTEALPLRPSGHIVCGNACRIDWNEVCPHTAEEEVYVMGNPPYLGSELQTKEQKEEITEVFRNIKNCKISDYIAIWFNLASGYINGSKSKFAFVSTNSICQGEQTAVLWPLILKRKEEITFAYTSFK